MDEGPQQAGSISRISLISLHRIKAEAGFIAVRLFGVARIGRNQNPIARAQKHAVSRDIKMKRARHDDANLVERVAVVAQAWAGRHELFHRFEPFALKHQSHLLAGGENGGLPTVHEHGLPHKRSGFALKARHFGSIPDLIQDNTLKISRFPQVFFIQGRKVKSMSQSVGNEKIEQLVQIKEFVAKSSGLRSRSHTDTGMQISQQADGKVIAIAAADLEEVIHRVDSDGQVFLQVNFNSGKKILLTQNLIGFKPAPSRGLDLSKLPKVVTTPDLLSVVEAIEDSMTSTPTQPEELDVLKKVFDSVLRGAEAVGFDTTSERIWLQGLTRKTKASA